MEQSLPSGDIDHCFPSQNSSCSVDIQVEYLIVNAIISIFLSVVTVFGNLLVITSICVFRQLHSPANILTLSLAVTDLLVGVIIMPTNSVRLLVSCWRFGITMCWFYNVFTWAITTSSLCHVVLIAINQYFAVCLPLQYNCKMSINRTVKCIFLCWTISFLYNILLTYFAHLEEEVPNVCADECMGSFDNNLVITDMIITFIIPGTIIFILYAQIFRVALKHLIKINSTRQCNREKRALRIHEKKATKSLGTVVFVYLCCWIPLYISLMNADKMSNPNLAVKYIMYLFYFNSSVNPFIYAFFHPWFKKSTKLILTLKILKPSSVDLNILPGSK
ncbi:trace amine-associated receptor 13c-like [Brienomyrus brachyistius]|uniref:trace amine-associated receptor 13c-like n=1 Tax=Brienomyrus brachyistius TaxID=42636 RepID=UPI0020B34025|nr:trace amine-associated receptor 13c-like [Brienomyrus brachyistius]